MAAEHTLNPLTVLKGYQQLVDEGLVEKKRGRGMFVTTGARSHLMRDERERFLEQEWPRVLSTIERLGLDSDRPAEEAPPGLISPAPGQARSASSDASTASVCCFASMRGGSNLYITGVTSRPSRVDETRPPMITMASGE